MRSEGGEGLWAHGGFSNFWPALPRNGFQSGRANPAGNNQRLPWKDVSTMMNSPRQPSLAFLLVITFKQKKLF